MPWPRLFCKVQSHPILENCPAPAPAPGPAGEPKSAQEEGRLVPSPPKPKILGFCRFLDPSLSF